MNVNKKKKTLKISLFSSFFAISSVLATSVTLVSCAKKSDIKVPSSTASSFSSLSSNIYPTIAGVLSAESGRESLTKSYVNKLLFNWFGSVNESSSETSFKDWKKNAEKSYKTEYDDYKKNKGRNWEQLFQQNVLDPVGGTKEDFINDKIISNLKSKFIDNLFSSSSKEYLVHKSEDGQTITPIKELAASELESIDNKYVNGKTAGEKNGFTFAGEAVPEVDRKTIDFGFADFLDFLMDSWIQNEMPLPLSMSLWKNGTSEVKVKQLFSNYFTQNKTPEGFAEGSYNFQYFEPIDENDSQKLTTTTKFKLLVENLNKGSYVDKTTGLIKLNTQYTEDSSTTLLVPSNKLFDGTYVTPFSAAAWYKFSSKVFGIIDQNVHTLETIDSDSIMKNFLYYGNTSSAFVETPVPNKKGVFEFPYATTWDNNQTQQKGSVFLGEYKDAKGIRDLVDLNESTKLKTTTTQDANSTSALGNFILVRNTFGVHIIGIDRLSKMVEAYKGSTGQSTTINDFNYANFQKVLNELRNTFIYYLAQDARSGGDTYKVKDSLKTYLTNNFESVVLSYVKKYIDNPSGNKNNLFGAKITSNNTSDSIDYNTNLGFVDDVEGKSYIDYYKTLNELKQNGQDSKFRILIDSSENIKYAKKALDFDKQMKSAIYENQSKYNSNTSATAWIDNGIAGVLPFTRDGNNGDFTALSQLVNNIVSKKSTSTVKTSNDRYINQKASSELGVVNGSTSITVNNVETYFKKQKLNYQTSVVNYINSINLFVDPKKQTGISTYIFTNNEYINKALLATGSDGTLNSIVYNSYIQKSLFPKGTLAGSMASRSLNYASTTPGTTAWISEQIKKSIKSTYFVNNFVGIKNLYSEGDWNTYDTFQKKAETYWTSNWERDEFQYSITNPGSNQYGFNTYTKPSDSEAYYKFLLTIKYLLTWNSKKQSFEFTKIHEILENATRVTNSNSGKAMIAWQNMSSIVANPGFGISSSTSVTEIKNKMNEDSKFKSLPMYLTNSNSYSWLGQVNPYKLPDAQTNTDASNKFTKNDLAYTTSTNYWYTAPMTPSSSSSKQTTTNNMGFLGFQMEDTSETGISNGLPTAAFDNVTYSYAISNTTNGAKENQEQVKYRGMFYSFKNRETIVQHAKELSTVNLLTDFYNKNLKDSGLPISEATKKKITEIIDGTEPNRVELLQKEILTILQDQSQLPDIAFQKMTGMPIWNNENNVNSTLFATSDDTQALKNQYIISQFNSEDVKNLLTITETDNGDQDVKLNTGTNGFLGVGSDAFFNAVLMMANGSTKLQSQAMDAMFREVGKIEIFDIRLLNVVDRIWISNYDVWKKVKDLS